MSITLKHSSAMLLKGVAELARFFWCELSQYFLKVKGGALGNISLLCCVLHRETHEIFLRGNSDDKRGAA